MKTILLKISNILSFLFEKLIQALMIFGVTMLGLYLSIKFFETYSPRIAEQTPEPTDVELLVKALPPKSLINLARFADGIGAEDLSFSCGRDSHPSVCNDEIKRRTVKVELLNGSGSGVVFAGNTENAVVITARHVIEESYAKGLPVEIKTDQGGFFRPLVSCVGRGPGTKSTFGEDIAFVFTQNFSGQLFNNLQQTDLAPREVRIGEFAGNTSNAINAVSERYRKDEIAILPTLWTGASGSAVYTKGGVLAGLYVGRISNGSSKLGIAIRLPEISPAFLATVIGRYNCFDHLAGKPISEDTVRSYYDLAIAKKVASGN